MLLSKENFYLLLFLVSLLRHRRSQLVEFQTKLRDKSSQIKHIYRNNCERHKQRECYKSLWIEHPKELRIWFFLFGCTNKWLLLQTLNKTNKNI